MGLTVKIDEETRVPVAELVEAYLRMSEADATDGAFVPYTVTSFRALREQQDNGEAKPNGKQIMSEFGHLMNNVAYHADCNNRPALMRDLVNELIAELKLKDGALQENIAESMGGVESLEESAAEVADNQRPLFLRVKLIEPGFGNSRDGHYYSAEMLKRCADVFKGVKMYETDHRDAEKSTRTEVSKIVDILGFTESGAPIARVAAYDPYFAQKLRNMQSIGELGSMECSILATGVIKPGEVGGKKAKIVESITKASSVDWVTKAGAGGAAMDIIENETGGTMDKAEEGEVEVAVTETVTEDEEAAVTETIAESEPVAALSAAQVVEALVESGLPKAALKRLAVNEYATVETLAEAIKAEKAYIAEVAVKSEAKPVVTNAGHNHTAVDKGTQTAPLEERENSILKRYGMI